MIRVNGKYIKMHEGDYGEIITFKLTNGNILSTDDVTFIVEDMESKDDIISKKVNYIDSTTFEISFTQAETNLLKQGKYLWGILQERDGELIDTLSINNYLVVERGLYNGD